ncbi:MAG TPA: hypothetical protein VFY40_05075 [Blastocatellia bacterium]|nr:hypothetical protein [Blastocatellia bacterium]
MAKVIGVYDSSEAAEDAIARLSAAGIDASRLSIIGEAVAKRSSHWKKSFLWGGALGAAGSLLLPEGRHLPPAVHLASAIAIHALGVTAKAMVTGAVVGGAAGMLRRAGRDRRAVKKAADAVAAGRYALALESDWMTMQRARVALTRDHERADPRLLELARRYGYESKGSAIWRRKARNWRRSRLRRLRASILMACQYLSNNSRKR